MKLKVPPPPDRTVDQLRSHFEIEREIASRLRRAGRQERARIYRTMYGELFEKVPDHPRLIRREDRARTAAVNAARLKLLDGFLDRNVVAAEFGCGDCRFAFDLCRRVKFVYGVDISDQRGGSSGMPGNFELVIFDGYNLPLGADSIDLAVSDQLIEHLHPDDVVLHFQMVRNVLKEGGLYVLHTPHRFTGPHDVSRYFCDEPEGFHLKEWTFAELVPRLRGLGYRSVDAFRSMKSRRVRVPARCLVMIESLLQRLPRWARRAPARRLLGEVFLAAWK